MKKSLGVIGSLVLIIVLAVYFHYNQRLQLDEISDVSKQNVKTMTITSTTHKAPKVKLSKQADVKEILEFLNTVKYKPTFFIVKPLGSLYSISFEDVSSHKSCTINFIGRDMVLIDGDYYLTDMYLNKKILTYLTVKGHARKLDNYFVEDIQREINEVKNKYGVSNPQVVSIKADIAENNQGPMFGVKFKGKFKKGKQKATFLTFSMLTERSHIWSIKATDNKGKIIWRE